MNKEKWNTLVMLARENGMLSADSDFSIGVRWADSELASLRAEVERLKDILEPIQESKERAEAMGRKIDGWIEYAKKLEADAGTAVSEENARLRTRVREVADRNDSLHAELSEAGKFAERALEMAGEERSRLAMADRLAEAFEWAMRHVENVFALAGPDDREKVQLEVARTVLSAYRQGKKEVPG